MELSYKSMLVIAERARPDQLPVGDFDALASLVKLCTEYLDVWAKQEEFWDAVAVADFASEIAWTIKGFTNDDGLAQWVVSQVPTPTDKSKSTRSAFQAMTDHVHGFLHLVELGDGAGEATLPLTILGHLFQAASGGLMIVATTYQNEMSLSTQSSAFSSGLAAINEAASAMKKTLAGKL